MVGLADLEETEAREPFIATVATGAMAETVAGVGMGVMEAIY